LDNYDGYNQILTNKDDIYNLSVRKKAASVCNRILAALKHLETAYIELGDSSAHEFIQSNGQIALICRNILKTINVKMPKREIVFSSGGDIRLYICSLLTDIAEGIISLSNIISIRHIERELIYASESILRQLIYILPYKLE
jgi:hypothetical protein